MNIQTPFSLCKRDDRPSERIGDGEEVKVAVEEYWETVKGDTHRVSAPQYINCFHIIYSRLTPLTRNASMKQDTNTCVHAPCLRATAGRVDHECAQ
jgi:hypothetical protein